MQTCRPILQIKVLVDDTMGSHLIHYLISSREQRLSRFFIVCVCDLFDGSQSRIWRPVVKSVVAKGH